MRAIVIDTFGGADRLHPADVPVPEPALGEVLIHIACTSVNPVDWKVREGLLADAFVHDFPLIPGWDAAGTIAAVGGAETGFKVGDRVYAYCRKPLVQWGTYAEYVTVRADVVAPIPAGLDFAAASTVPLAGLTAWQSLFEAGELRAGQSVLVHAGAGGVGGFAIQFAKAAGARVATTASAANHDYVRALGADLAIDYRTEDVGAQLRQWAPGGVDLLLDTVGGDTLHAGYAMLKPGGILVSIVDRPRPEEAHAHGVRCAYVFVDPSGEHLRAISRLIEAGSVHSPVFDELPLEQAPEAHRRSETRHGRGKIVLRIQPPADRPTSSR